MLKRHLESELLDSLSNFPVVLLVGARQVGKSTLVQALGRKKWPARYLNLDDRTVLDAALSGPDDFLQDNGWPSIVDEVQRAPDLLRAVKLVVDRDRRPGMFLLTGSANVLTLKSVSETLAGRVAVHELLPFSWAEQKRKPAPGWIDTLFSAGSTRELLRKLPSSARAQRAEIKRCILAGGYPTPALMKPGKARHNWFAGYRQTYIERDVREITDISHLPEFNRLMTTMALRTGKMLNMSELSRDLQLPYATMRRYLDLLAQTFQIILLQPYLANVGKRLVKTPKLYMTDTGMACHLSMADTWEMLDGQNRAGAMVETWMAAELRKQLPLASLPTSLWYWRTRAGQEVDFILERGDRVVGIEVKWSAGFKPRDIAGLRACRDTLGERFRCGMLLHSGTEVVSVDRRILAVPFGVFLGTARTG